MKKTLTLLITSFLALTINAQIKGSASATYGILNPKIRLQYEYPMGDRASVGATLNYYLINWTGPKLDVFGRIYTKSTGNEEGGFFQAKVGYGNLSTLDFDERYIKNSRWSTFGFGLAGGHKFLLGEHFIIEPLIGFHIYTSPKITYTEEYSKFESDIIGTVEDIGWYLTTGLPIDFQLKFGYQF